ncbi:hypothetical protein ABNF97_32445 [Plantactinospora sp. B6F1]|uniref:hypothetical protein n=1 Tax=Plantactinospora sp. B6F1 TaxID=3158971 RepID=UPI00102CDFEF
MVRVAVATADLVWVLGEGDPGQRADQQRIRFGEKRYGVFFSPKLISLLAAGWSVGGQAVGNACQCCEV